jgi:hypothetical protein
MAFYKAGLLLGSAQPDQSLPRMSELVRSASFKPRFDKKTPVNRVTTSWDFFSA